MLTPGQVVALVSLPRHKDLGSPGAPRPLCRHTELLPRNGRNWLQVRGEELLQSNPSMRVAGSRFHLEITRLY